MDNIIRIVSTLMTVNYERRLVHNTKNVQMNTRGERTGIFPIIIKRIQMKEKGQLHTPAALTLGEKASDNSRIGSFVNPKIDRVFGEDKDIIPVPEI